MTRILSLFLLVASAGGSGIAQTEYCGQTHITPCHTHQNSICYGYAMGRAFGRLNGDPICNPAITYADRIDASHFDFYPNSYPYQDLQGLREGDIISFGSGQGNSGHAAYVVFVPTETDEDPLPIPEM